MFADASFHQRVGLDGQVSIPEQKEIVCELAGPCQHLLPATSKAVSGRSSQAPTAGLIADIDANSFFKGTTPWGEPWDRQQLTEAWNYERKTNPALLPLLKADLVLHGLRGHACVRLYRAGLNSRDVSVLVGMSVPMVERYCRLSEQKKNALAAVLKLEPRKPLNLKVST